MQPVFSYIIIFQLGPFDQSIGPQQLVSTTFLLIIQYMLMPVLNEAQWSCGQAGALAAFWAYGPWAAATWCWAAPDGRKCCKLRRVPWQNWGNSLGGWSNWWYPEMVILKMILNHDLVWCSWLVGLYLSKTVGFIMGVCWLETIVSCAININRLTTTRWK